MILGALTCTSQQLLNRKTRQGAFSSCSQGRYLSPYAHSRGRYFSPQTHNSFGMPCETCLLDIRWLAIARRLCKFASIRSLSSAQFFYQHLTSFIVRLDVYYSFIERWTFQIVQRNNHIGDFVDDAFRAGSAHTPTAVPAKSWAPVANPDFAATTLRPFAVFIEAMEVTNSAVEPLAP
jgi:hypothetical protein